MKRIFFLIPNLAHGGAERVLVNLANNLDQSRFDVTVQTLFDIGVNRQYLKPHVHYIPGAKKQFHGNTTLMKLFSPERLYKSVIRGKYDVLVSYLEGPTSRIISGCHEPDVKRVAWIHSTLPTSKQAAIGFRSPAEAVKLYNTFDRIVAVAEGVKRTFEKSLSVSTPIDVLYNTNETEKIKKLAEETVNDSELECEGKKVCSVAKIVHIKGFDRLLCVHKRLLDEGIKHTIFLFGIGEERERLEAEAKKLGVSGTFRFLGFKDNPYKYVKNCDLYVCSSHREGFSTAVTESLIVGTPVVSTDCSGARELLGENNEYGIVVENSEDGIYEGMKRMLTEPGLLDSYCKKAAIRGEKFNREETVAAVERMLESL